MSKGVGLLPVRAKGGASRSSLSRGITCCMLSALSAIVAFLLGSTDHSSKNV